MEFNNLTNRLNEIVKHDPTKNYSPSVTSNPSFIECSCKCLVENTLYIFCPDQEPQEEVKKKIKSYVENANLHFIVTTIKRCGTIECRGHLVDPFKAEADNKHVLVDGFPENINGSSVYFLNKNSYKAFEIIRNPEE